MSIIGFLKEVLGISGDLQSRTFNTINFNLLSIRKLADDATEEDIELKKRLDEIYEVAKKQTIRYKANYSFLQGLIYNLEKTREDVNIYNNLQTSNEKSRVKEIILKRLLRRKEGLEVREELIQETTIPRHTMHDESGNVVVKDLPDWGLYGYHQNSMRKSKYIELEVVHYTTKKNYDAIKRAYQREQEQIFFPDQNGWVYFLSTALPLGLSNKEARLIIGIGNQFYVGKTTARDPEVEMSFRIRVKAERMFEKEEKYRMYSLGTDREITTKKYAIAGGIMLTDVVSRPQAEIYRCQAKLKDKFYRHKGVEYW